MSISLRINSDVSFRIDSFNECVERNTEQNNMPALHLDIKVYGNDSNVLNLVKPYVVNDSIDLLELCNDETGKVLYTLQGYDSIYRASVLYDEELDKMVTQVLFEPKE